MGFIVIEHNVVQHCHVFSETSILPLTNEVVRNQQVCTFVCLVSNVTGRLPPLEVKKTKLLKTCAKIE